MRKTDKDLLRKQVDVFISWGQRNGQVSDGYEGWLTLFVNTTFKTDIMDVTGDDLHLFLDKAWQIARGQHDKNVAKKAIESLVRYYSARKKNGDTRSKRGRPPQLSEIERTQTYRQKGLSYKDISTLTGKKYSQIWREIHYKIDQ